MRRDDILYPAVSISVGPTQMLRFYRIAYRATQTSMKAGTWHHVCLVWESKGGVWQLYKDGQIAAAGRAANKGRTIPGSF